MIAWRSTSSAPPACCGPAERWHIASGRPLPPSPLTRRRRGTSSAPFVPNCFRAQPSRCRSESRRRRTRGAPTSPASSCRGACSSPRTAVPRSPTARSQCRMTAVSRFGTLVWVCALTLPTARPWWTSGRLRTTGPCGLCGRATPNGGRSRSRSISRMPKAMTTGPTSGWHSTPTTGSPSSTSRPTGRFGARLGSRGARRRTSRNPSTSTG